MGNKEPSGEDHWCSYYMRRQQSSWQSCSGAPLFRKAEPVGVLSAKPSHIQQRCLPCTHPYSAFFWLTAPTTLPKLSASLPAPLQIHTAVAGLGAMVVPGSHMHCGSFACACRHAFVPHLRKALMLERTCRKGQGGHLQN